MAFSATVQQAFDGWIDVDTWYTSHALDEARFHRFVWAAVNDNCNLSEGDVEREILNRWKGRLHEDYLVPAAHQWASLYRSLFDFGNARDN